MSFRRQEALKALGRDAFLYLYGSSYVALGISCMCVPTP